MFDDVPNLPVNMIRPDMAGIPRYEFPSGYSMRTMRAGEGVLWTDVQRDSEPIITVTDDLFEREFGDDLPATERRCFFAVDANGAAVGAISAWYSREFRGTADWGRIHWFALRPKVRGSGLAKPVASYALQKLAEWHTRAWLATSTARLPAIKIYLDLGFRPDLEGDGAPDAWRQVTGRLKHPGLAGVIGHEDDQSPAPHRS